MCGIAGIVSDGAGWARLGGITGMADALAHRGPDDEGYAVFRADGSGVCLAGGPATPATAWSLDAPYAPAVRRENLGAHGAGLALGHRRLSILDLSPAGRQPMCTPDGRYWIVYNGEIYNHVELREDLERAGETFRSTSDTEVLLRLLALRGEAALGELEGMFALALYDSHRRTLLLARDPFGIKPLYWCAWPGGMAFASEPKALLTLDGVVRAADPEQVGRYLAGLPTDGGERTFFADVRRLPAGHLLTVTVPAAVVSGPYRWFDPTPAPQSTMGFMQAAAVLRGMFLAGVARHMRSDIPVGAALSGGLDSSAVLVAMRHHAPDADLSAFSFDAGKDAPSEIGHARTAAQAAAARIHVVMAEPADLGRDMADLIRAHDEPVRSASVYAQYRVMAAAADSGVRVLLDGQGADELAAGYRPMVASRMASLVSRWQIFEAVRLWRAALALPDVSGAALVLRAGKLLLPPWAERVARAVPALRLLPRWVDACWLAERGALPHPAPAPHGPDHLRAACLDALTASYLPELLRYEDRNSMAHSVESRLPFLTPELAGFLLHLPEGHLVGADARGKAVLRSALHGIVPDAILDRRDKIGFVAPDAAWLRAAPHWLRGVLHGDGPPMFDMPALRREAERFLGGGAYAERLWRGAMLAAWARELGVEFDGGGAR
ncbi:asparagine synthase (glutamine-hydrolysing) [Desulfobaculum xiamenense]|uniref:asparagine synthase (glutamine-hydrolyzing) n=1 Tax=Desulfobaculum xiamenense TaxID=995050 RepID=A0A846QM40_9BACT|nr:asparagine synthase (glutamine-hydrolyzing) [Desulfobaculum xiamenense]NJB69228.1 asparagine synthase (glutamine-hydrolysing) [Desulfobaculum xiamenense]